ncbi:tolloid-like protein 1 [Dreissena polymorpha]|uniref:tolloid-like protein 1 n=1 Tax=Dreissena polymorpha TaxID=45954 RepID=UPI002264B4F3|nr:tolloid-like protein 1 [Dreissena polymorpha]
MSVLVRSAFFIVVDASSCGGTFKSNYGEITSPNYPSSHGPNLSCVWRIDGAPGSRLVIGFKDFSLEKQAVCRMDYIEIRHGNVTTSKYCGEIIPDRVITQSENATIVFVTNQETNRRGFHLFWKVFTEPLLMESPVSWESANTECEQNGGKLMEPDLDYLDTYRESIIEWMGAHNVSNVWVRKYFTPWVSLKGCTRETHVHPQKTYTVQNNQQKICQYLCSNYNYFGLKGRDCVCLNDVASSYVVVSAFASCKFSCKGNTEELCGGENAYTVYKNNICYTSSKAWNGALSKDIYGSSCLP